MEVKTIKEALLKGERVTLECKRAKSEAPKELWKTYSAFANTIGGLILLGIDENLKEKAPSKRFQIIGVEDAQKIRTDFWNTINSDNETVSAPVNASVNAPVKLSKTQLAIVKAILKNKYVTYEDLSSVVRAHRTTIMRNMAALKKNGVIRRVGGDKNGYWQLLIDIKALNP